MCIVHLGMEQSEQSSSNVVRRSNTATGPIIPESDFNKVKVTPEIEKMVQQVLAVFPDAPQHLIRKDLCKYTVIILNTYSA